MNDYRILIAGVVVAVVAIAGFYIFSPEETVAPPAAAPAASAPAGTASPAGQPAEPPKQ